MEWAVLDETSTHIEIEHHPASGISEPEIIPLDASIPHIASSNGTSGPPLDSETRRVHSAYPDPEALNPFAPFRCQADFEFTELAVTARLSKHTINALLKGHHSWIESGRSKITFRSYSDMLDALNRAREFVIQVNFICSEIIYTNCYDCGSSKPPLFQPNTTEQCITSIFVSVIHGNGY
jgi:hypothetical protein